PTEALEVLAGERARVVAAREDDLEAGLAEQRLHAQRHVEVRLLLDDAVGAGAGLVTAVTGVEGDDDGGGLGGGALGRRPANAGGVAVIGGAADTGDAG